MQSRVKMFRGIIIIRRDEDDSFKIQVPNEYLAQQISIKKKNTSRYLKKKKNVKSSAGGRKYNYYYIVT